jgi:acyl-CoA hydrolase
MNKKVKFVEVYLKEKCSLTGKASLTVKVAILDEESYNKMLDSVKNIFKEVDIHPNLNQEIIGVKSINISFED